MSYRKIQGNYAYHGQRVGILASAFNGFIVDSLIKGSLDALMRHGVSEDMIEVIQVPGAYELPIVAKKLAMKKRYDGLIALGAIIRGGTAHFEYVAGQCASGLSKVSLDFDIPIAFGVLTTNTIEEAIERAGTKAGNKGAEASVSLLEMINLLKEIEAIS